MKKLIALILILVITSFVVVSKDSKGLDIKNAIVKSSNPKNEKWEYVKDRLFDGETEKVYRIEGPILLFLCKATKQDSLAVKETMQELRTILPHKTIDYFNNIIRVSTKNKPDYFNKKIEGYPDQYSESTIKLNFLDGMQNAPPDFYTSRIGDNNEIGRSGFSKYYGSVYNRNSMIFSFNKLIPYERRKRNIQYEILRTLCYVLPDKLYPIDSNKHGVFYTSEYLSDQFKINELDKFLIQKLYSDDFIDQFKTYMYANYPWRYASSFINKKEHEIKASAIVVVVGILVFVLMFSYFQNRKYKYSYLNYLIPTFFVFIYYFNLSILYTYLTTFNAIISWTNNCLFLLILAIVVSFLSSFLLWGLEKICFKGNENFSYKLVLKVIFTFITFITPLTLIILKFNSKVNLEDSISYLFFAAGLAFGRGLLIYLNHFSASLVKEKDVELSRLREAKADAEVKVLQSQINPHFLYNALNSIASLAHTDADKTEKMALSLSDLFRHTINRKGEKANTLKDEVNLLRSYLEIEQIRFGDRLKFSITVQEDLLPLEIPRFILQPLVENAVKHGISKIEGQGEITVEITKKDNGILISVLDNGPDFPEGLVSGHGLQTVYDLLRFSYGDKAEICWHNQPKKEITIYMES